MDYQNFQERLKRLSVLIGDLQDNDVSRHVKTETTALGGNKFSTKISFGAIHEGASAENKIISIIAGVAKMRDHLKKKAQAAGIDSKIIDNLAREDKHLCWVMDIDNQEKHGLPLDRPWSKEMPIITKERSCLKLNNKARNSVASIEFGINGLMRTSDNACISLEADIYDNKGQYLCTLNELIEKALARLEVIHDNLMT